MVSCTTWPVCRSGHVREFRESTGPGLPRGDVLWTILHDPDADNNPRESSPSPFHIELVPISPILTTL